jgi:hypothetical protein
VSEGRAHPKTNAYWPVSSQLGAGHEPVGGAARPCHGRRRTILLGPADVAAGLVA